MRLIFQHLETVIKSRIPGLQSLINKTIVELEGELTRLGKPIAADAGVRNFLLFVSFHSLSILGQVLWLSYPFWAPLLDACSVKHW